MNLSEVQYQPWSTVVVNFYICQSCSRVDTDSSRQRVGTPCNYCGAPSPSGLLHFGIAAYVLVNSIQDFYFLRHAKPPPDSQDIADEIYTNKTDTRIVIPLLYCTLWDALTTELCQNIMRAKKLQDSLQDRLLLDYRSSREKRDRLFRGLTGEKWNDALTELSKQFDLNYSNHFEFFLAINRKRNDFIHEGVHWNLTDEELERIPGELQPTFSLFAELHNRCVP
jgi:hypothetical protein